MKTAKLKKSASSKPSSSSYKKEVMSMEQIAPASQPGDMDVLERYSGRPMPTAFEQIDQTYKTIHSLLGWPSAIV